jgi:hypothetical protein
MTDALQVTPADNLAATKIAHAIGGMIPYRLADLAEHPPYKAALMAMRAERAAIIAWLQAQSKEWATFPEEQAYQIAADAIEARAFGAAT